jgi:hypothetical protein
LTEHHPITPPPELVEQWRAKAPRCRDGGIAREDWLMVRAAQWGADQELEACCEWLDGPRITRGYSDALKKHRRPKPPSLKEQALADIDLIYTNQPTATFDDHFVRIRRALEALPDD